MEAIHFFSVFWHILFLCTISVPRSKLKRARTRKMWSNSFTIALEWWMLRIRQGGWIYPCFYFNLLIPYHCRASLLSKSFLSESMVHISRADAPKSPHASHDPWTMSMMQIAFFVSICHPLLLLKDQETESWQINTFFIHFSIHWPLSTESVRVWSIYATGIRGNL